MKYTEKKALEIIEKFELSPNTLKVWKSRDKIPDKYFKEGFQKPEKLTSKQDNQLKQLIKIEFLNFACMSVKYSKIQDYKRQDEKQTKLSKQDFILLLADVSQVLTKLRAFKSVPNNKNLSTLTADKRIKKFVLFRDNKLALDRFKNKRDVYDYEFKSMKLEATKATNLLITLTK